MPEVPELSEPPEVPDVAPKPLRDVIADAIREQILSGAVKPGRRLREDEIAQDHGVSRVPVREALQRLESEGYLALTPYRGATVTIPSREKALEAMQVRRALEVMAARLAARVRGRPVAQELVSLVRRGNKAAAAHRHSEIPALVERFHQLIAVASGNADLEELLARYRGKVGWMFAVDLEGRAESSWAEHAAVLDAVLAGDEDEAGRRMDLHVSHDERDCAISAES